MPSRSWSWRNIIKKPLSEQELSRAWAGISGLSDRSAALVCVALVERALEKAILTRFIKLSLRARKELFDSRGPLSSFYSKTRMGLALGLFGTKGVKELDRIREIRNVFAHSAHDVRFSTARVKQSCHSLTSPKRIIPALLVVCGLRTFEEIDLDLKLKYRLENAREQFVYACCITWLLLESAELKRPMKYRTPPWHNFMNP